VEQIHDRGPFKDAPTILTSDPPVHTRLRRLVSREFTPRRIRKIEPRIREITSQLLDAVQRKESSKRLGQSAAGDGDRGRT
jgi:cytochrome P450